MDPRALLDELLRSGRDLAAQAQTTAERKLSIPEAGPEREAMLSGLGKGAALGGLLALLLGTRSGRRLTGTSLKLGGLAAVGALAYKAFGDWHAKQGAAAAGIAGATIDRLSGPEAEQRSLALLKAMIAAAKADGHIDEQERIQIDAELKKLLPDAATADFLQQEIDKPLRAADIAACADSPEAAVEMYLISLAVIDRQSEAERRYLDELAAELKLSPSLLETLELEARSGDTAGT